MNQPSQHTDDTGAETPDIDTVRAFFDGDHFATRQCEATIDEAAPGHAVSTSPSSAITATPWAT